MALLLVAGLRAYGAARVGLTLAPGDLAPPLAAPALTGWKYRANWQDYPLTIVNFWASWCAPCKTEMPVLQELYGKHGRSDLAVVGVALDPLGDEELEKFAADLGASYTLVRGSTDISNVWGGIGLLPTTFLVNERGRILRRYVGATPEAVESLKADVEAFFRDRMQKAPKVSPSPAPTPLPKK